MTASIVHMLYMDDLKLIAESCCSNRGPDCSGQGSKHSWYEIGVEEMQSCTYAEGKVYRSMKTNTQRYSGTSPLHMQGNCGLSSSICSTPVQEKQATLYLGDGSRLGLSPG